MQLRGLPARAVLLRRSTGVIVRHFITLTQPWASLMAHGWKTIETRSWRTRFSGPLAIHAAKGFPKVCRTLFDLEFFGPMLLQSGYTSAEQLPLGKLLAVCFLDRCETTDYMRGIISPMEEAFGDYSPGRFAFVTSELRRMKVEIPMVGGLGIRRLAHPITEDFLIE